LIETGGRILLILVLAFLTAWFLQRLIRPVIRVAIREQMNGEPEVEVQKRIETVSDVLYRTMVVVIAAVAIITILPEFGVNAGPLIASLGLLGIAVGFGAQKLVRDVIGGIEILLENQYGRGDYVGFRSSSGGTVAGTVEDVNLRRTIIRDIDGAVHFISHSHIDMASNFTRGYSRVAFNITVPYTADLDRILSEIDAIGAGLANDPNFKPLIREAPKARGVESLGENALQVRIEGITEPGEQWRVASELRFRLKRIFDKEGISVQDDGDRPAAGSSETAAKDAP
jgi:moderate conductance mechanosensitive channel